MAFSFLYLAVRALLGALLRSRRGLHVKDVELLVLRRELEILRRQGVRRELRMVDRALLAAAACHLPRSWREVLLVTPRTLNARAQSGSCKVLKRSSSQGLDADGTREVLDHRPANGRRA